ncbi:zinc finger protein 329, partial [Haplochromis burtoni]|uniref:zinc finger protein 329 n=1 Tax=Haplochromis burtoni TaxID=8153 RepID=UPI001C2D8018
MCSVEYLREFVSERLTAAAEEIFGVFVKTMVQNEAEISQRRLQDITVKFPKIKLHRIDLPQQLVINDKDEALIEQQQHCNQERNSRLVQEEAEPLLIKEEQEEDCSMDTRDQQGTKHVEMGSTTNEELKPKKKCHRTKNYNVDSPMSGSHCNMDTDQLQQYVCKEEVLEDLYLFNLENSGLDQQDIGSAKIKEEWTELCTSQERQELVIDQETNPLTVIYEEKNYCQPKPSSHLLLSHNSLHQKRTSTDEKPYSCNTCGKRFKYASKLKIHTSIHTGEKPFSCDACGKTFRRKDNLLVHIRTHTGEKPYSCSICGKAFRDSSNLIYHIRFHTGEKRYSCETCGKRFYHKGNLTVHMVTHTGIKPYHCKICGKRFACLANLKIHARTHTGEKPYSCATCGKTFSQSTNLKFHTRIHTGEKPYPCEMCGKGFSQKDALTVHMRTHTGDKPYVCNTCGKRCLTSSTLTRHAAVHTCQKPYSCKT